MKLWIPCLIFVGLLAVLVLYIVLFGDDYEIWHGFDFATGESVVEKWDRNGEMLWRKRKAGPYAEFYRKYGLFALDEQVYMVSRTEYEFKIFKIDQFDKGWKFWEYHYYILRHRPGHREERSVILESFFRILELEPPEADARKMFEQCLRYCWEKIGDEEIEAYLREHHDRYEAPHLKAAIDAYLKNPGRDLQESGIYDLVQWTNVVRYLETHRKEYPRRLPETFYLGALEVYSPFNRIPEFFVAEYLADPSELNAFMAASVNLEINWQDVLRQLEEAGALDRFLETVMPEKLPREEALRRFELDRSLLLAHFREQAKKRITSESL